MNTNELRIGNLVNICEEDKVLTGIMKGGVYFGEHGFCANIIDFIQPIPLTEEWLKRLGFKKKEAISYDYYYKYFDQIATNGTQQQSKLSLGRKGTEVFINNVWICGIEYVHQLQNIYFALTGEELKLKDKL